MRQIKILYIVPRPNVGGLQTTLRNRIQALQPLGIQTEVVFFGEGDGEYIFKGIPYDYIKNETEFKRKIEGNDFQYISFIYSLDYLKHVPDSYKGKIIYEVRGWNPSIANFIKEIDNSQKVDAVLCIAQYLKKLVYQNLKGNVPVYVDGNTIAPMFHYIKPASRTWKGCPKPQKGHKIIGFVGRVQGEKNWIEFARICRRLSRKIEIELWIICNPNTSKDLTKMLNVCKRMGLEKRVKVIPHAPNHYMPEVYSAIRSSGGCILSTSKREGLGNHILEPLACGLPVVSSNVPGKNEVIKHRYNGMLYKLGEINRAVRYVTTVIENQGLRNKMEDNGLRKIRSEFNPERYARRYMELLSRI